MESDFSVSAPTSTKMRKPGFINEQEIIGGYRILRSVGSGTFGTVYKACKKDDTTHSGVYAVKFIYPTSRPSRILNELKCLKLLRGEKCIISLLDCFLYRSACLIVMPYFQHDDFKEYFRTLEMPKIIVYMHSLLTALAATEEAGIIHRDVKPRNVLFRVRDCKLLLVDFGLAELGSKWQTRQEAVQAHRDRQLKRMHPGYELSGSQKKARIAGSETSPSHLQKQPSQVDVPVSWPGVAAPFLGTNARHLARSTSVTAEQAGIPRAERAGTPGFRAPEVLLGCAEQTPGLDVWSAGIIFLSLLLGRYPLFTNADSDDLTSLMQICGLFGANKLKEAAKSCGKRIVLTLDEKQLNTPKTLQDISARKDFKENCKLNLVVSLINQCLELNPTKRIKATDSLSHCLFKNMFQENESFT